MGLSAALAVAGQSLEVFTAGIQVAGENIANAATPGYIRQELILDSGFSYKRGSLIFGTGVRATGIRQQIDQFLEKRIHAANADLAGSSTRGLLFNQLEAEIRELGDADLSTSLNLFLAAVHEVVNQPESAALRQIAIQQGELFAGDVVSLRFRIDELRKAQTGDIESLVLEANELIEEIVSLNKQITQIESAGLLASDAGALRTSRYNAMTRLSEIIPVRYEERENHAVDIYSGSEYIILGTQSQQLETVTDSSQGVGVVTVRLSETQSTITGLGGELQGIVDASDQVLGGFIDKLDTYASTLIFEFNKIHSSGEGLRGFTSVEATNEVEDVTAALNSTAAGLDFTAIHGSFELRVTDDATGLTETTVISIDLDGVDPANDTSLQDLQAALNAVNDVTATISNDGRLQINAGAGHEIAFGNDSSGVLAVLGINTFFTGTDSATISVNSVVSGNHQFLAAGQGGGPSDGSNAVLLARVAQSQLASLNGLTLEQFYELTVAEVGQASAAESTLNDGFRGFRDSLIAQRLQYTGVSIDEEAIKIIEFQRAFQASARVISVIDELFTTLLTM